MVVRVDDTVLLDAARAGDTAAFSELVRRHQEQVYRVALRMLGSPADAEDAAQDAFVRAWRSLGGFRGDSSVTTWLYRIVTNRCLSLLAARRETAQLPEATLRDRGDDLATVVARRAEIDAISTAVARLPGDQRAAIVLRDYEGLSYEEVAEILQIGLGAVKSRIHRGRADVLKTTLAWR